MNEPIQFSFNKKFVIFNPEGALVNSFDDIQDCKDWILKNVDAYETLGYRIKRRELEK